MVLVARNKLFNWLKGLTFSYTQHKGWTWAIIPEDSFEENGQIFDAVMYYKPDMSVKKLIFFHRSKNQYPTNKDMKDLVETNYDEIFSDLE